MRIELMKIPVGELIAEFTEDNDTGRVSAWDGYLDIRPPYQREFVYGEEQAAVINSVLNCYPLNAIYFVQRGGGTYEVLDGQQRILSICHYANNDFSVKRLKADGKSFDDINFANLPPELQCRFMNYEVHVYVCVDGTDKEKLEWFETINIAGKVLEPQEIRNAIYYSDWLNIAKSDFSRPNCPAYRRYGKYLKGECKRQKYLEAALLWKADSEGMTGKDAIAAYMKRNRHSCDAKDLWDYFEDVFDWVKEIFGPEIDPSMKGVPWGILYNAHKDDNLDPELIRTKVASLLVDDEVTNPSGIYSYVLDGDESHLNIRKFSDNQKKVMYARQEGKCALCGAARELREMHADHVKPWNRGGKTTLENGQMLCASCNIRKSDK